MKNVLLIHGWNYDNYTSRTNETDAWHNRKKLVNELSKYYNIYKLNLPGFCYEAEPNKTWNLDDYAKYIRDYINNNHLNIDFILGYSFGGAIAIRYKTMFKDETKIILVSPAIIRNNNKSKKFMRTPKLIQPIRNIIRNAYLIYIVKNKEMKYGTKFLRNTYQNIVRDNLLHELKTIDKDDYIIIYGTNDEMVNPKPASKSINSDNIKWIINGYHDIANTNYEEIVNIINKYIK